MIRILGLALLAFAAMLFPLAMAAPEQVTTSDKQDADPAISPDGKTLAFSSNRTGSFNIYLLAIGGSSVTQLTQSEHDDRRPAWSSDGKLIIFDSKRTGNKDLYETTSSGGGGFLQLTDGEMVEEGPTYTAKGGVLFASQVKKTFKVRDEFGLMIAASKDGLRNAQQIATGQEPRLSPDGTKVVYSSNRTKNRDIWITSSAGGPQSQLTTDAKDDENPCFSPDGKQIVFASKRTGTYDLWVMNADGTNVRQLTDGIENDAQPSWAKNGYIYFTRSPEMGKSQIFRIAAPS